jgi:hypothetical protein
MLIKSIGSPDRFPDSGMLITEAIQRAQKWWDDVGRELCTHLTGNRPKSIITLREEQNAGIMSGLPWEALNKRERYKIVMVWHSQWCIDHGLKKPKKQIIADAGK